MAEADQYEVLDQIGHGSFGIIRKVKRRTDGHVLCRKEINYKRMSQKEREQLHAEFSILNSLRHPNIVAYYHREHFKTSQDLHLYMEYCGNGDLARIIKDLKMNGQLAEEEFVWAIFTQLVTALYRCHYGVDPPDAGRNVLGAGNPVKRKTVGGKAQVMILHRDLKPENVFLGDDNSVKLGDFGLSKIMQSHDFASTYVGTPFYMSPEICAAERYTLHSDIWSLGCIMYELCSREPPFNAKTHFQLVQKIKEGKLAPLPRVYSAELQSVIKSCLKVNPLQRPDTASLLNLPVVKLMRKEREVVDIGKALKLKEETAAQKLAELERKVQNYEAEQKKMRVELDASLRREWEVKARLEIDRQIQQERELLYKRFEAEVREKVQAEVVLQLRSKASSKENVAPTLANDIPLSSVSTNGDTDFPSTTDFTELSLDSPVASKTKSHQKGTRTPFVRSQTMFIGSPMDIQMVDPSPMSIASLSLSPRRNGGMSSNSAKNIFAAAADHQLDPTFDVHSDDDDDELPPIPSPTRQKAGGRFRVPRPPLVSQKTAPLPKLNSQPSLSALATGKPLGSPPKPSLQSQPDLRAISQADGAQNEKRSSPSRRMSKIPATAISAPNDAGSPTRKPRKPLFPSSASSNPQAGGGDMFKAVTKNNMMRGRTLIELAQARAGGRQLPDQDGEPVKTDKRPIAGNGEIKMAARMADVVWDPEKDEMPSPFLARNARVARLM
ncbi:MAG: G2-specific serine/threonine protein kinase [Piccolia ochrophora]|nr:MAG: G2-specific serine/threonine protein kinase [Piccolia ochrophora]